MKLEKPSIIEAAIKLTLDLDIPHGVLFSVAKRFESTLIGKKFAVWEKLLENCPDSYTIVRSEVFFNLMNFFIDQIKSPGHSVHHWMGVGRFCPVDPGDVGACIAAVLKGGPIVFHKQDFTICGPKFVDFRELCTNLSHVLGYHVIPVGDTTQEQMKSTLSAKLPQSYVEELVQLYHVVSIGREETPKADVVKLIGRAKNARTVFQEKKAVFS